MLGGIRVPGELKAEVGAAPGEGRDGGEVVLWPTSAIITGVTADTTPAATNIHARNTKLLSGLLSSASPCSPLTRQTRDVPVGVFSCPELYR